MVYGASQTSQGNIGGPYGGGFFGNYGNGFGIQPVIDIGKVNDYSRDNNDKLRGDITQIIGSTITNALTNSGNKVG